MKRIICGVSMHYLIQLVTAMVFLPRFDFISFVRYPIHCYSTCDGAASRTGVLHSLEDTVGGFVLGDLVLGGWVLSALVVSACIGTLAVRLRKGTLAAEQRPGGRDRSDGLHGPLFTTSEYFS